jgi:uncharacterized protein (DUF2132 family)
MTNVTTNVGNNNSFVALLMENKISNDPLHGITLQKIVEDLVSFYGFDTLGELIRIRCFTTNPSIKSSLTFLRKTDWARKQVEDLYVRTLPKLNK